MTLLSIQYIANTISNVVYPPLYAKSRFSHDMAHLKEGVGQAVSDDDGNKLSLVVRKPVFGVSDQVPHKPGCTATEDGWRLEISDLDRREIVLSV